MLDKSGVIFTAAPTQAPSPTIVEYLHDVSWLNRRVRSILISLVLLFFVVIPVYAVVNTPEETPIVVTENEASVVTATDINTTPTSTPTVTPTITPTPTPQPVVQTAVGYRPSNYDHVYMEAGAKYGVPWQILYGLHLTETGLRDGMIMNRQGSGARDPMQFMPNTWRAYGVDGDGDGVANIDNAVDAIHGAANYVSAQSDLMKGLIRYGCNIPKTLAAACSRGFCM